MPREIRIVPIRPGLIESFRLAVGEVASERRWLMTTEAFSAEATEAFVHMGLAGGLPHFVAVEDDDVVGWCDIVRPAPYPGFEHNGRLGMGVLSAWRGQGIGGALLDSALRAAPAAGFGRIELEVLAGNTAARALYESRGFLVEGLKRGARVLDGVSEDLVCMALRLPG